MTITPENFDFVVYCVGILSFICGFISGKFYDR